MKLNCKNIFFTDSATKRLLINTFPGDKVSVLWLNIIAVYKIKSFIIHVILMFSAVNEVDFSALESLEAINRRLKDLGIGLHLSEVKGPVMDKLISSHFLTDLNGRFFLSQYDAWQALKPRHETPRAAE